MKDVMQSFCIGKEEPLFLGFVNTSANEGVACTCTEASLDAKHSTVFPEPRKLWLADLPLTGYDRIVPFEGNRQAVVTCVRHW